MPATTYIWIGAIVFFTIAEAATVSLVSMWFIGGGLAALVLSFLGCGFGVQLLVFLAVSTLLLVLMRPLLRKRIMPKKEATNADRLIGQEALVIQRISNLEQTGAIRVNGVEWTARGESEETIEEGSRIRVTRLSGAKVFVVPVKESVSVS